MNKLLLLLLLGSGGVRAEFWDGNRLYSHQTASSVYDQMLALGYVMGVADALAGVRICSPENATAGQKDDVVKKYLREHPALRHHTADSLVVRALERVWPCQERRRGSTS